MILSATRFPLEGQIRIRGRSIGNNQSCFRSPL